MNTDEKKKRILQAASDCFARFGYEKTTLEDIGKASKLNKASLYYYFKNKEEIYLQVVLSESERYIQNLQKTTLNIEDEQQQIIHYLTERLKYYDQVVNLHQFTVETLRRIEPEFDQLYQMVETQEVKFIALLLDKGIQTQKFFPHDSQKVAESIIKIANAFKHEAYHLSAKMYAKEIDFTQTVTQINFIIQLIFKGLKR